MGLMMLKIRGFWCNKVTKSPCIKAKKESISKGLREKVQF